MSKYARFECDRCGRSVETEDGTAPTAEWHKIDAGIAGKDKIDLCPSCYDEMRTMMEERRKAWAVSLREWVIEGQAQKGARQ